MRHCALAGVTLTGGGVAGIHYVLLPSIHAGHPYLPSPLAWLLTLAVVILVPPEFYLLLKAANAETQEAYERYKHLMIGWPYALVAPIIALATKALPRPYFAQDERGQAKPMTTGEILYTEKQVSEMLAMTLNRIYALRVDRDILTMTNDELRKIADEVAAFQREARKFGDPKPAGPSASGRIHPPLA